MLKWETERTGPGTLALGNPTFTAAHIPIQRYSTLYIQPQECALLKLYLGLHGVSPRPCLCLSWTEWTLPLVSPIKTFFGSFY